MSIDTQTLRERFEKKCPIPDGVEYDDKMDCYFYVAPESQLQAYEYQLMYGTYQSGAEDNQPQETNARHHGCEFEGWQCFHCSEIFTTVGGARDHFGELPTAIAGCIEKVKLGDERGLLMALRKAESLAENRQAEIDELKIKLADYDEFTIEQLRQKVVDILSDNEQLSHSNKQLKRKLEDNQCVVELPKIIEVKDQKYPYDTPCLYYSANEVIAAIKASNARIK